MDNQTAGLSDNVAGLLAYFGIPALGFLLIEPYKGRAFIRFHAFQALFLWAACLVLEVGLNMVATVMPFMVAVLWPLLSLIGLAIMGISVLCMVKAYNNETFSLPILGELALKQAGR